jgi:hypothetical protein
MSSGRMYCMWVTPQVGADTTTMQNIGQRLNDVLEGRALLVTFDELETMFVASRSRCHEWSYRGVRESGAHAPHTLR